MGLKGSLLDGAAGQSALFARVPVSSVQKIIELGSLKGSNGKNDGLLAFGAGLERIASGRLDGLLTGIEQDCLTPQRE